MTVWPFVLFRANKITKIHWRSLKVANEFVHWICSPFCHFTATQPTVLHIFGFLLREFMNNTSAADKCYSFHFCMTTNLSTSVGLFFSYNIFPLLAHRNEQSIKGEKSLNTLVFCSYNVALYTSFRKSIIIYFCNCL